MQSKPQALERRQGVTLYKALIYVFASIGFVTALCLILFLSFVVPRARAIARQMSDQAHPQPVEVYIVDLDASLPDSSVTAGLADFYWRLYDSLRQDSVFRFDSQLPQHGFIVKNNRETQAVMLVFNRHCGCEVSGLFDALIVRAELADGLPLERDRWVSSGLLRAEYPFNILALVKDERAGQIMIMSRREMTRLSDKDRL